MTLNKYSRHSAAASAAGFTLIELLVVMAILSILCGLSLKGYYLYRWHALSKLSLNSVRTAKVALEAGINDAIDGPPRWFGGWTNQPGEIRDWAGNKFLPGFVNGKNQEVMAFYNTWCDQFPNDWCMHKGITVHNCKGGKFIMWNQWYNGIEVYREFDAAPTC